MQYIPLLVALGALMSQALVLATDGSVPDETGCPAVFLKRCTCGMKKYIHWRQDEELYIVNCTNTRFEETDMLSMLPPQTQVLIFSGNNVSFLDWNIFGMVYDREDFEVVDLSNNNIQEITGKAFHKVSNVKRLVLNHNDLRISGKLLHHRLLTNFYNLEELHLTNAFTELIDSKWYLADLKDIFVTSNMTKLNKLHLEQNEIWNITDKLFCSLPALSQLYLGDNQLSDIDFDLSCLPELQHVDLQFNKIKRLGLASVARLDEVFSRSNKVRKINFKGNPLTCDCHFRTFLDWVKNSDAIYEKEELTCYSGTPEVNAGRKLSNVARLECPEIPHATHDINHSITHGLLVTLIVLLVILVLVLLVIHRDRVRSNVKPLIVSFQKSMQYRSIDKSPEVTEVNV